MNPSLHTADIIAQALFASSIVFCIVTVVAYIAGAKWPRKRIR